MDELSRTASTDSRSTPLVVRSYGATDRGRLRPTNEDQFFIADLTKAMHVRQTSLAQPPARFGEQHGHLFLVADGMGGHHAGEHASALAVTLIEQFALNTFKWFMPLTAADAEHVATDFQEAVEQADATIVEVARKRAELHGMGTTLTLAYHYEAELLVIHVGDSRAYLFRDGTLHQITQDHTVVAEMMRRGELDSAEARRHRLRHVITNVVGGTEAGVDAEAHSVELRPADALLLCSDGLTEMLSHSDITEVVRGEPDPEVACTRLISLANERGGQDNITAIVARFSAPVAARADAITKRTAAE
jgi:serine/threonine protein phosphatase PrpC